MMKFQKRKMKKNSKAELFDRNDREDKMSLQGEVEEALPGTLFKVICDSHAVLATLSGKMRQHQIHILPGDRVTVEVSPYDTSRGRIVRRH